MDRSQLELRGAHDAENARRGGCLRCLRDGFVGVGLRRPGSCEKGASGHRHQISVAVRLRPV